MNAHNVKNASVMSHLSIDTNEHTQERSLLLASSVASVLPDQEMCEYMKKYTQERSLIHVISVVSVSVNRAICCFIKEDIPKRNLIHVNSVVNVLGKHNIYRNIRKDTLE